MATNEILTFADSVSADILTQSAYSSDPQRLIGHQIGIARQDLENKVLRQTTFMSAALAQFIVDITGQNVLDDGNDVTLLANMKLATKGRIGTNIASASTTSIGADSSGDVIHITGTTTITSLGTSITGYKKALIFDGILTLTHNVTSLILPGASNIITSAGSAGVFVCIDGALGYWKCLGYQDDIVNKADLKTYLDPFYQTEQYKNKLINSNFDIWDYATTQTTSGFGSDNRWNNTHSGSTKTHSQQVFTLGQTDVLGNPKYFSRTAVTSVAGAGNYVAKSQPIECVETLSGQNITISFYAKADAPKNIAIELTQNFGTGGSPSAVVTGIGAQLVAVTASWAKYTATIAVPSIAGKTLGTNGDDALGLNIWFDAGSSLNARSASLGQQSGTFDLAQIQIESGSYATKYDKRNLATEVKDCARYYRKIKGAAGALRYVFHANSAATYTIPIVFGAMRTTPVSTKNGTWTVSNCAQPTVTSSGTDTIYISTAATGLGQCIFAMDSTDDSIELSAEIA